jgi:hypothetical protein
MIRPASAAAIAALMSTAAMAQSPNTPMTQPVLKAPMAQSASGQMGPSARFMATMPANGTTLTTYYKQNVNDPADNKIGDVRDLIIDEDGRIIAAIIGIGGKIVTKVLTVNTTKDELKGAPGLKYDRDATTWVPDKSASNAVHKMSLPIGTMPGE